MSRHFHIALWLAAWPCVLIVGCAKGVRTAAIVHLPEGYDFVSSIEGEELTVDEFCLMHAKAMARPAHETTYGLALANQTLGLVKRDPSRIAAAREYYANCCAAADDVREKEICQLGMQYCDAILCGKFARHDASNDRVEPVVYERSPCRAGDFHRIILGESAIRVPHGAIVKTQVDRVVRDWLQAYDVKNSPWAYSRQNATEWHEGALTSKLVDFAGAKVVPVWGMRARKFGNEWFAPDAEGIYRFSVLADKVECFPTAIVVDERTAIVNDTHGISALAWDSLDADLVVGCGDHTGKMDAAYYLAEHGVNVYVPTDRFIGLLIGTSNKGMIIGSGPLKKDGDGAIIGDQPITIEVEEPIVVAAVTTKAYPLKYYDAALRYFEALQDYCGKQLNLIPVEVKEYGHAEVVVDEARRLGVGVIATRVKSRREHDALAAWLQEDQSHRAVLFHSVAYPDGSRLFSEFPRQTSFGDVHPRFE